MKNYIRNFRFYNKSNEFGAILALVAGIFSVVIFGLAFGFSAMAGQPLSFGAWATLPVLFIALAVAHYAARPIVSARIHGQR